jgi:hypothetical protein
MAGSFMVIVGFCTLLASANLIVEFILMGIGIILMTKAGSMYREEDKLAYRRIVK